MNPLGLIFLAFPFVVMLALGVVVPLALVAAYNSFAFGIGAIVSWAFVEAALFDAAGLNIGLNLYYTDFVMIIVAIAAGLRFLFAKDNPKRHWAWLVFCMTILVSAVSGMVSFGTSAGVQVRPYFYFASAGLYAMSFRVDDARLKYLYNSLTLAAGAFLVLTYYRWCVYYLPITELLPEGGVYNIDGAIRVIGSQSTLVVAMVAIASLFYAQAAPALRWARVLAPLFLGTVVALQHRSVWLCFLIGVVASLMIARSKNGSLFMQFVYLGLMAVGISLGAAFGGGAGGSGGLAQQVQGSALRAVGGQDTTGERLRSWREIIRNWYSAGPRSIAIGQAFGADASRIVEADGGGKRRIDYQAHNLYVQTLFNMGLIGVVALLAGTWYVIVGLYRICAAGADPPAQLLLALLLMQQAYYIPYGADYLQSMIFGVALAYVSSKRAISSGTEPLTGNVLLRTT